MSRFNCSNEDYYGSGSMYGNQCGQGYGNNNRGRCCGNRGCQGSCSQYNQGGYYPPQYPYPPYPQFQQCPPIPVPPTPTPTPTTTGITGITVAFTGTGTTPETPNATPVPFDTVVHQSNANMVLDSTAGTVTITRPGTYHATWWVSTDGTETNVSPRFDFTINGGTTGTVQVPSVSPTVTGQVVGNTTFTVASVPAVITLVNQTGENINYGNTTYHALMSIIG